MKYDLLDVSLKVNNRLRSCKSNGGLFPKGCSK